MKHPADHEADAAESERLTLRQRNQSIQRNAEHIWFVEYLRELLICLVRRRRYSARGLSFRPKPIMLRSCVPAGRHFGNGLWLLSPRRMQASGPPQERFPWAAEFSLAGCAATG